MVVDYLEATFLWFFVLFKCFFLELTDFLCFFSNLFHFDNFNLFYQIQYLVYQNLYPIVIWEDSFIVFKTKIQILVSLD